MSTKKATASHPPFRKHLSNSLRGGVKKKECEVQLYQVLYKIIFFIDYYISLLYIIVIMTDLSVKPAQEIKTEDDYVEEMETIHRGDKNKADIPKPEVKLPTNLDIFDAPAKKTIGRIKKQKEKLQKQQARLTLKENRLALKRQKDELKAQRLRIKEQEAKYKKAHPRKKRATKPKPITKKVVKAPAPAPAPAPTPAPTPAPAPTPRGTPIQRRTTINDLSEEELKKLWKVFKQADEQSKPKVIVPSKPTINYINPIEDHAFSHLSNPFNF